jgi:peptide/nickel transport system permease protein
LAGRTRDRLPDVLIRILGILTYAAPIFFVGFLLQVYVAPPLGLPTSGDASPITKFEVQPVTHILLIDVFINGDPAAIEDVSKHLILPAVTLGLLICGVFIRLVRVNVLETMQSDYVEAAEARGIARGKVTRRHAFRNALVPVITVLGLQFALLLDGAVQGIITIFALAVIFISLLVDIVNALIDPRVRY